MDTSGISPEKVRVQNPLGTHSKGCPSQDFFEEIDFMQSFPKELMSKLRQTGQWNLVWKESGKQEGCC